MKRVILGLLLLASLAIYPAIGQGSAAEPTRAEAHQVGSPEHSEAEAGVHETTSSDHGEGGGHSNPVAPVLLGLIIILLGARIGGWVAEQFHQPAVLGELLFGVVLGNLTLFGIGGFEFLANNSGIQILAELGVILLLFEVGLESNVHEMLSVGMSSLMVAILGIVAPFALGWGVSAWMLPTEDTLVHVFIAATLCATSVGITARVLADLGKLQTRESKIVLGAAVIDDILGLVILAVVTGSIQAANQGTNLDTGSVAMIIAKAALFLIGALAIGGWIAPHMFRLSSRLRGEGLLVTVSLSFCFLLAYLANAIELATIVGAFAAGLILDEVHYRDLVPDGREHALDELLQPIAAILVPIFFVRMGLEVDLATFGQVQVLGLAALLTLAAIVGKAVCAVGVLEKGLDRWSVAVGMIPRGEVGLIFAAIGASLTLHGQPVVPPSIFSAVVIMVIVTTLITPPSLKITLSRGEKQKHL